MNRIILGRVGNRRSPAIRGALYPGAGSASANFNGMARPHIKGNQGSPECQGLAEEFFENRFLVPIFAGMLFPNERIGSDRVQGRKIVCSQRPEFEEFALQPGLEIKGHA
jgi:hypothetical protein